MSPIFLTIRLTGIHKERMMRWSNIFCVLLAGCTIDVGSLDNVNKEFVPDFEAVVSLDNSQIVYFDPAEDEAYAGTVFKCASDVELLQSYDIQYKWFESYGKMRLQTLEAS